MTQLKNSLLRENDETGKILVSTMQPNGAYGYRDSNIHRYDNSITKTGDIYVELAVKSPITGGDEFYHANRLFGLMQQIEPYLLPTLMASLLLMLIGFIYLCCAAGHRKGHEGITLNGLDKIPFDLYAVALGFGVTLLVLVAFDLAGPSYYNYQLYFAFGSVLLVPATVLSLGIILSFTTRVKAGKWWRNTVIYYVLQWLLRNGKRLCQGLVGILHAIPMIWRTLVLLPPIIILDLLLFYWGTWDGFWLIWAFFYNVAILMAVGFGVWQLRKLQKAGKELAGGNFEYKTDTQKMYWDFKQHAENLNAIGGGMTIAVEQRMRSERLKTELITNVSHDIKTPLTSIVNYVDLLQKPHTEDEGREYLAVLQRQSARLKKLTEDLVEASKASTGNVSANMVRTNVVEIVNQALGEYAERLAAGNLTVLTDLPEKEAPVLADGRLLWRIMDNLLSNVCKYALAGTRVYVSVGCDGETVIAVKNISREPLNVSADELMERFVRGDTARSTEGSGLGLNIAKSLTQLQGGSFELFVDGDFFKAEVRFPGL